LFGTPSREGAAQRAPSNDNGSSNGAASQTAAVADARNPARVIPIWIVTKNWFG
jgi:hypothetical protein